MVAAPSARAHILEPRKGLEGFLRRADVIVFARVREATRSENPKVSVYPLLTDLEVEKVFKGANVPKTVVMTGHDDHAPRYPKDQRVLVFLHGRPGVDARLQGDQSKGEEIYLGVGDDAGWAAFLEAAVSVHKTHPDLFSNPAYRAALFDALGATGKRLREHALRRVSLWSSEPNLPAGEVAALLAALKQKSHPDRYRMGLLNAGLAHFTTDSLRALAESAGESPMLRGALLDGWAARAGAKKAAPGEKEAMRAAAMAVYAQDEPNLKLYAATALARIGDTTGLAVLKTALADTDLRRKRIAIRGLARLRRAQLHEADALLRRAKATETDGRVRRWLDEALPRGTPTPPKAGLPTMVWLGIGLGAAVLVALTIFSAVLVRRRRRAAQARG